LTRFAYPQIGHLPVAAIDTALVLKCLEPIWAEKTDTASRLRGRIETVLDWAKARDYRLSACGQGRDRPGFSFSQATNSLGFFAGKVFRPTNQIGQSAISDIGSKSFTTSKESAKVAPLTTWVCQCPRMVV
jgi:hypothetical protein